MTNQAFIGNKDIFTNWRAQLVKGAYEALLTPPPMKEYIVNQSRQSAGRQYVATSANAKTDEREVVISFFIEGSNETQYLANFEGFVNALSAGTIEFKVTRLKRIYKLIYMSSSRYGDYGLTKGKLTVKFKEPSISDRVTIK